MSLCTVFDANWFVFGDFSVHHKAWLTYSGGADRSGELCYNFFISNDLIKMVNFTSWIPDCDSYSPVFWTYLILILFISHLFKNVGERSTAKNCHPVSLLAMVSKVFEKLVNNRLVNHLEKCGLLSDFQYGLGLLDQLQIF